MEISVGVLLSDDEEEIVDEAYETIEIFEEIVSEEIDETFVEEEEIVEEDSYYGEDFDYKYNYKDISHKNAEPIAIYTSKYGSVVVTGDNRGHVFISTNSGAKWKKIALVGPNDDDNDDEIIYITGLVMSTNGEEMIVGTNRKLIYHSKDYGTTFNVRSKHRCSLMAASEDIKNIICINGNPGEINYLLISSDKGSSWEKSESPASEWIGIVSNEDFSHIIAIKKYTFDYVWKSTDKGVTFKLICNNERNEWGNLCSSRDLSVLVLTDAKTLNSHVSEDYGKIPPLKYLVLSLLSLLSYHYYHYYRKNMATNFLPPKT